MRRTPSCVISTSHMSPGFIHRGGLRARIDPRVGMGAGLAIAICGFVLCTNIDPGWAEQDFRMPLLLQATGGTLEFTSLVYFLGHHFQPSDGLTVGALLQSSRLIGGEVGAALLVMFTRKAEQWHSSFTGQHIVSGAPDTLDRLTAYANAVAAQSQGKGTAEARALGLLAQAVSKQAYTLSIADGFLLAASIGAIGLVVTLLLLEPPANVSSPPIADMQDKRSTNNTSPQTMRSR